MVPSRRTIMTAGAASLLLPAAGVSANVPPDLSSRIRKLFHALPGTNALKIWAPATSGSEEILVAIHPNRKIFVASAFKAYVLAALLKSLDSPDVVARLKETDLSLDKTFFSFGSDVFNQPDLTGIVSLRTAAEAMIMHSDNTATNMVMAYIGVDAIRKFIADMGFTETQIPDSTRTFGAYLFGLADYKTATYDEVLAAAQAANGILAHPFLNPVETMASTASNLISLYMCTLQDGFFENLETLAEYRRILSLADGVFEAVPLDAHGFAKTGYADFPNQHARSNAGAMTFAGRWVYFATVINWGSPEGADPETVIQWQAALRTSLQLIYDQLSPQS
jgi:beta-lactamase class A